MRRHQKRGALSQRLKYAIRPANKFYSRLAVLFALAKCTGIEKKEGESVIFRRDRIRRVQEEAAFALLPVQMHMRYKGAHPKKDVRACFVEPLALLSWSIGAKSV